MLDTDDDSRPADDNGIPASSVTRTINLVGDKWTLLVLQEMFLGATRFRDWRKRIGVARSTLVNRLQRLLDSNCIEKVSEHDDGGNHHYRLTRRGTELYPVFLTIWRWEMRWFGDPNRPKVRLIHEKCGKQTEPQLTCGHCHQKVDARSTTYEPGPGAGRDPRQPHRHHRRSTVKFKAQKGRTTFNKAAEILGDHWTHLVIGAPFLGFRRFDAIQKEWKIPTNILADRLNRLVKDGLLTKRLYQQRPKRYEYLLTEKGLDIYPMNVIMTQWGDRWLAGPEGPPLIIYHKDCGHRLDPKITCSECGGELIYQDMRCEELA